MFYLEVLPSAYVLIGWCHLHFLSCSDGLKGILTSNLFTPQKNKKGWFHYPKENGLDQGKGIVFDKNYWFLVDKQALGLSGTTYRPDLLLARLSIEHVSLRYLTSSRLVFSLE